jgi:hypothetical protein
MSDPRTLETSPDSAPMVPNVPKVNIVMSLKNNDDFLMHGVVLQNRVSRPRSPNVSRETMGVCSLDVSSETFLRKAPHTRPLGL